MNKEKKGYCRSVRMTETIRAYVEVQPGEGFNEKFENMIVFCMKREQELKKSVSDKEKQLRTLNAKIGKAQTILTDIDNMKRRIESATAGAITDIENMRRRVEVVINAANTMSDAAE